MKLETKLQRKTSVLTDQEVAFVTRETEKLFKSTFGSIDLKGRSLNQSLEDIIRWSAVRAKCEVERAKLGLTIPEIAKKLKLPQYRLKAVEEKRVSSFQPESANRYFQFLGMEAWVQRWTRGNADLATRLGLRRSSGRRKHANKRQ